MKETILNLVKRDIRSTDRNDWQIAARYDLSPNTVAVIRENMAAEWLDNEIEDAAERAARAIVDQVFAEDLLHANVEHVTIDNVQLFRRVGC